MWFLFVLSVGFALSGFLVGRGIVVAPAAAAPSLYWYSLKAGWWGYGVGDGWQYALVVMTILAVAGVATGVVARRRLRWS
jgi:hypothetical protein